MSLLSIVLPAYNEEQNIANTAKVLGELLEQHGIDYELVFISDGSKDGTFERIKEESARNPRVRGAEFSRNFGKEAGIFAGLELTTGVPRSWKVSRPTAVRRVWDISCLPDFFTRS